MKKFMNSRLFIIGFILHFLIVSYTSAVTYSNGSIGWWNTLSWNPPPLVAPQNGSSVDNLIIQTGLVRTNPGLSNWPSVVIQTGGYLQQRMNGISNSNVTIENTGTLEMLDGTFINASTTITVKSGGTLTLHNVANNGTIIVESGGTLVVSNGANTVSGDGTITVQNGGTMDLNNAAGVDTNISIEAGGIIDFPNSISFGGNTNLTIQGNLNEPGANVTFSDVPDNGAVITVSGSINLKNITPSVSGAGGTLIANAIAVSQFNVLGPTLELDMFFSATTGTTISTFNGGGTAVITGGDATITNTNITAMNANISAESGNDITFTNAVTISGTGSLETHSTGLNIDNGMAISTTGTPNLFYATDINLNGIVGISSATSIYLKGDVTQQGNVTVNQVPGVSTFLMDNWDSNGFGTALNIDASTFQIDNNVHFDNLSGSSTAGSAFNIGGNAYLNGTTFTGAGNISIGGLTYIESLVMDFSAGSFSLNENTVAAYDASGLYTSASYDGVSYYLWDDNAVFPAPNINNVSGHYASNNGGTFTLAGSVTPPVIPPSSFPLPVELTSFKVRQDGDKIDIYWVTKSEDKNDFFTIKHSTDGFLYSYLDEVDGAGSSSFTQTYSLYHDNPVRGLNYYKLYQTDFDGTTECISTASVNYTVDILFQQFNNRISVYSESDNECEITVVSITGLILQRISMVQTAEIIIGKPGTYICKIQQGAYVDVFKCIVR